MAALTPRDRDHELRKIALSLVAIDPAFARTCSAALNTYARRRKLTRANYVAVRFADMIDDAIARVERGE